MPSAWYWALPPAGLLMPMSHGSFTYPAHAVAPTGNGAVALKPGAWPSM